MQLPTLPSLTRPKIVLLILGALVLLGVPLLILTLSRTSPPPSQPAGQIHNLPSSGFLPIRPYNSSVKSVHVTYALSSKLQDVVTARGKTTLLLSSNNEKIPPLPLGENTEVYFINRSKGTKRKAAVSDISKSANVFLIANFDMQKGEWTTLVVQILE